MFEEVIRHIEKTMYFTNMSSRDYSSVFVLMFPGSKMKLNSVTQNLCYFLQSGDNAATIISLCSLRDMNLQSERCQTAIADAGGLEVLINILETDNARCIVR